LSDSAKAGMHILSGHAVLKSVPYYWENSKCKDCRPGVCHRTLQCATCDGVIFDTKHYTYEELEEKFRGLIQRYREKDDYHAANSRTETEQGKASTMQTSTSQGGLSQGSRTLGPNSI